MDTIDVDGQVYNLASLTERLIGQILDFVVYMLLLVIPGILAAVLLSSWLGGAAGLILAMLYLVFQDGLGAGESYGKRIIGTRVIDATTGASCTFFQSFIRNLLLVVLGFFDWIFILFGDRRQRLGDRAAGTVVIKMDVDSPPPEGSAFDGD